MSSSAWTILTKRYGEDIHQPSDVVLADAANELFVENIVGMTEADYAEHPSAWLRHGFDNGPVFVVEASRKGDVFLFKYADQDDADPVAESAIHGVSQEQLLSLWRLLAQGDVEQIRRNYPSCGW
jgi:hypothetical protein